MLRPGVLAVLLMCMAWLILHAPPDTQAQGPVAAAEDQPISEPDPAAVPAGAEGDGAPQTCSRFAAGQPAFGPVPESRAELRQLYLTGLCQLSTEDWYSAEATFRQGVSQDETLRPYWNLRLFNALLPQDKPSQTELILHELMLADPGRAVVDAVRDLLERYTVSDHPARQVGYHRLIGAYFAAVPPKPGDHDLALRQWNLSLVYGTPDDRARALLRLWQTPRTREEALRWGETMQAQRDELKLAPAGEAYLRRARRLNTLRLFERNGEEIVGADLGGLTPEESRQLGRIYFSGLFRLREYSRAVAELALAQTRARFAFSSVDVLDLSIQLELRRRHIGTAVRLLGELETLNPVPAAVPGFYIELARINHEKGNGQALRKWARRLIARYPGHALTGEAYWSIVWWYYRAGEFQRAVETANAALGDAEAMDHGERARLAYWRFRALGRLGRSDEAGRAAESLRERYPNSYYGLILAHQGDGADPLAQAFSRQIKLDTDSRPPPQAPAAWNDEHLRPVLFLYSVMETEQAKGALEGVFGRKLPREALVELADLSYYHQQYHVLQRIVANYFLDDLRTEPVRRAMPWEHAYPPAYWGIVEQESAREDIHPLLALAIMREESKFDPEVESAAGAKGLMQLMPPTARQISHSQGAPFNEQQLLLPEGNIPLGVAYLGRVLRRFNGDLIYAAAAYNAGPTSVNRWIKAFGNLPHDEWVESIPYTETQRYVKKVMGTFLIYLSLYT
ncbi:MAG: lytic transglycosylase domain-containing protein [Candidatus Lambdaproteobacteria bacterium]|nr:lytic transglycosylase domain-containing protein [Candidatus Lambdaproteobacteria bacterium]